MPSVFVRCCAYAATNPLDDTRKAYNGVQKKRANARATICLALHCLVQPKKRMAALGCIQRGHTTRRCRMPSAHKRYELSSQAARSRSVRLQSFVTT